MHRTELLSYVELLQPVTTRKLCDFLEVNDVKSIDLISHQLAYYYRKRYLSRTRISDWPPEYIYELGTQGKARLHSARKRAARLLAEQLHGKTPGIHQGIP
jgi:hypothetical protein